MLTWLPTSVKTGIATAWEYTPNCFKGCCKCCNNESDETDLADPSAHYIDGNPSTESKTAQAAEQILSPVAPVVDTTPPCLFSAIPPYAPTPSAASASPLTDRPNSSVLPLINESPGSPLAPSATPLAPSATPLMDESPLEETPPPHHSMFTPGEFTPGDSEWETDSAEGNDEKTLDESVATVESVKTVTGMPLPQLETVCDGIEAEEPAPVEEPSPKAAAPLSIRAPISTKPIREITIFIIHNNTANLYRVLRALVNINVLISSLTVALNTREARKCLIDQAAAQVLTLQYMDNLLHLDVAEHKPTQLYHPAEHPNFDIIILDCEERKVKNIVEDLHRTSCQSLLINCPAKDSEKMARWIKRNFSS